MNTNTWHNTKTSWGDAAVDGLLAGVVAGVLMAAFLLALALAAGQSWQWLLQQFDPGAAPTPLAGAITHLAVSGVYGILFGAAWRPVSRGWRRLPTWLAGLVYGLLLWLLAVMVTSARSGVGGSWLQGIPPAHLAVAHALYGLALGWLVNHFRRH